MVSRGILYCTGLRGHLSGAEDCRWASRALSRWTLRRPARSSAAQTTELPAKPAPTRQATAACTMTFGSAQDVDLDLDLHGQFLLSPPV